jgi:hypothetical protein
MGSEGSFLPSDEESCPSERSELPGSRGRGSPAGNTDSPLPFSGFLRKNRRTASSVGHRADFFFDFRDIHHDDGIPGAAIEEAAIRTFAEALLAADTLKGVNLDSAKRRMVFVRHPEHAIFHGAILDASRRARATRAALGDHGEFFGLFLPRRGDPLGARLLLQFVGHQSRGFYNLGFRGHGLNYTFDSAIL